MLPLYASALKKLNDKSRLVLYETMAGCDHSNNDNDSQHCPTCNIWHHTGGSSRSVLPSTTWKERYQFMEDQTMGDQNTDPCYQDRSLCATRMGEMVGSLALLSTCLGSENRQGWTTILLYFLSWIIEFGTKITCPCPAIILDLSFCFFFLLLTKLGILAERPK